MIELKKKKHYKLSIPERREMLRIFQWAFKHAAVMSQFYPKQMQKRVKEFEDNKNKENKDYLGNVKRVKDIEELQKRLNKLKGRRLLDYNDKLLKKGLKNRIKKKQRLEERLMKKTEFKKNNKGNKVKSIKAEDELVKEEKVAQEKDNVIFNQFDFNEEPEVKQGTKDPKQILKNIEKSKTKLKKLEETGHKDKVAKIKNKTAWDKAIQQASGVKIKDDVELLKKSIAKKSQQKNRSAKKWEERKKNIEKKKEDTQKKRKENLMAKKKEKKQKNIKRSIKKGRVVIK